MQTKYNKTTYAVLQDCVKRGMKRADIAKHLNLDPKRLDGALSMLGLTAKNMRTNVANITSESEIKNAASSGMNLRDAAQFLNVSHNLLRKTAGCLEISFRQRTKLVKVPKHENFKYKAHNPFNL